MSYNYVYLRSLERNDMRGQKIFKIVITMLDRFVQVMDTVKKRVTKFDIKF